MAQRASSARFSELGEAAPATWLSTARQALGCCSAAAPCCMATTPGGPNGRAGRDSPRDAGLARRSLKASWQNRAMEPLRPPKPHR